MKYLQCKVCVNGILQKAKKFRMSGPVVAIGFILLVPSVIGIVVSLIILLVLFGALGAGARGAGDPIETAKKEIRANLAQAGVPQPIVLKVVEADTITSAELDGLSENQQKQVISSQSQLITAKMAVAGAGVAGAGAGGIAVCFGVSSFVSGLLGWLLVMRKRVLQCNVCGAVVAAS
jgi:hypothetical protein